MPKKEQGASTSVDSTTERGKRAQKQRERRARRTKREKPAAVGIQGVPGSKNPSRRCRTIKKNGEQCKAAAIKGGFTCRQHGGNLPQVKKAAKQRLLELVDPALAALHKVLTDPNTDDHNKVRAAQVVLDRAGFKPGMVVEVQTSKWDQAADEVYTDGGADRSSLLPGDTRALPGGVGNHTWEDKAQLAWNAQEDADRDNAEPEVFRIYPDANTVRGEVVDPIAPPPHLRD